MKIVQVSVFVLIWVSASHGNEPVKQPNRETDVLAPQQNTTLLSNKSNLNGQTCKKEATTRSGKYFLQPPGYEVPFEGYCEHAAFDGGWLIVQYRFDGSVDFFRNWTDYQNGFGSLDGEFWLGLEHLHRLTSARQYELLVEVKDFNGTYKYARYDHFLIAGESEQYALKNLGQYTGTAFDNLEYHKGMKFSTKDRDNDRSGANCASKYKGAWWYNACLVSSLNGLYKRTSSIDSMLWGTSNRLAPLAYTRMSIRET